MVPGVLAGAAGAATTGAVVAGGAGLAAAGEDADALACHDIMLAVILHIVL